MNRNDMRSLAVELNKIGIKDIIGFNLNSKQQAGSLRLDLEDAITELIRANELDSFADSLKSDASLVALEVIVAALKKNEGVREIEAAAEFERRGGEPSDEEREEPQSRPEFEEATEEDFKDEPQLPDEDMDGCHFHLPDESALDMSEVPIGGDPEKVSIEEVASGIKLRKGRAKKEYQRKNPLRAKRNSWYPWIAERMENAANYPNPPTRANLLAEMAVAFPANKPKSLLTMLAGTKSWKWTKLDYLLVEDKDGLFSIGERRKK